MQMCSDIEGEATLRWDPQALSSAPDIKKAEVVAEFARIMEKPETQFEDIKWCL